MSTAAPLPQWPSHPKRSRIRGWIWKALGVVSFVMALFWPVVFMLLGWIEPGDVETQRSGFELGLLFFGLIGVKCYMRGKRHFAIAATELLAKDTRPPVIYLRSFQHDRKGSGSAAGSRFWGGWGALFDLKTVEERLAEALTAIGPVIAIGKPGEKLPALGAARLYVGDDEWQDAIQSLMARAKLVVLLLGDTPGFWWELERSVKDLPPERLVLIVPFKKRRYEAFREKAAAHFRHALPDYGSRVGWFSFRFRPRRGLGKLVGLIYFRRDWTSEYVDLTKIKPTKGFRLNYYGHHRMKSSLNWNLRPVFQQLGLEWTPPKTRRGYLAAGALAASMVIVGLAGTAFTALPAYLDARRDRLARDASRDAFLQVVSDETRGRALARAGLLRLDDATVQDRQRLIAAGWSGTTEACLPAILQGADPAPSHLAMQFISPVDVATWYWILSKAAAAESSGDPARAPSGEATREAFRAFVQRAPDVAYHDVFFIVRQRTTSDGVRRFIEALDVSDPYGFVQVYPSQVCAVFGALHREASIMPPPHGPTLARALAAALR